MERRSTYGSNDLDARERQTLQMPGWATFDFRLVYAFFQEQGLRASAEAIERLTRLLGPPPRVYDAFAVELAAA